jgi:hypothetical protein
MALKESKRGGNRITTNVMGRPYFHFVQFDTNSTSAPDGQVPTASCTATRASTGVYSITFAEECKPAVIHHVDAYAVDTSTLGLEYIVESRGYVASTGVLTIAVGVENTTTGVVTVGDSTDVTIKCLTLCNGVSKVAE